MGVRPTQLTISNLHCRSLGLIMICSKIHKICMNVEMCEICRPDTHAPTQQAEQILANPPNSLRANPCAAF